jgi:hypothetical protein
MLSGRRMNGECRKCGVLLDPDGSCFNCPPAPPPQIESPARDSNPPVLMVVPNGQRPPGRQVFITRASDIKPRPGRWLWPDRIPAGALTLLAGREGIGKRASSASTSPRSSPAAHSPAPATANPHG